MRLPRACFAGPVHARNRESGSAAPAVMLAALLVILVASTLYIFAARVYPPPPPITANASLVDRQYNRTLYVAGAVFILTQIGLAAAILRFRDRGQRVVFTRGSAALEVVWTSATVIAFLALAILGRRAWADARFTPAARDSIEVEVTTAQFAYTFRYAGPDGKFGRLDPSLINPATGNPLGIDPNDVYGKDDIVTATLTVPVDRPVELLIRSQDMVHNFFVRELRLQQDAVPGMVIPLHFTANRAGRYEIVCTQLCGLGHAQMYSALNVVSEAAYESFLKQQAVGP